MTRAITQSDMQALRVAVLLAVSALTFLKVCVRSCETIVDVLVERCGELQAGTGQLLVTSHTSRLMSSLSFTWHKRLINAGEL